MVVPTASLEPLWSAYERFELEGAAKVCPCSDRLLACLQWVLCRVLEQSMLLITPHVPICTVSADPPY